MSRQVLYLAAPLRPTSDEIVRQTMAEIRAEIDALRPHPDLGLPFAVPGDRQRTDPKVLALRANLDRAMRWLSWLRRSFPETTFIAPWIADILSGADDSDSAQREAGMQSNFAVLERCDGIVLCGGRISEGMDRESRHGTHRVLSGCSWFSLAPTIGGIPEFRVYDLTKLGVEPPNAGPHRGAFDREYRVWAEEQGW